MSKEEKKVVKEAAKDVARMSVRSAAQSPAKMMRKTQKRALKAKVKTSDRLALPYQRALRSKMASLQYLACIMNPSSENAVRQPDPFSTMTTGLLCPKETGVLGSAANQNMLCIKIFPGWETMMTGPTGFLNFGAVSSYPGGTGRQFFSYQSLGQTVLTGYRWVGLAFEVRVLEAPLTASGVLACAVEPGLVGGLASFTAVSTLSQYPGAVVATMSEVMANGGVFRGFLTFAANQIVMTSTFIATDQAFDPRSFRQRAAQPTETMPRLVFTAEGLSTSAVAFARFSLTVYGVLEFEALSSVLVLLNMDSNHRPEPEAFQLQEDASGAIGDHYRGVVPASVSDTTGPAEVFKTLATAEPYNQDSGVLSDYASNIRQALDVPMRASKHIWDAAKWAGSEALQNLPLGDMADAALGAGANYLGTLLA